MKNKALKNSIFVSSTGKSYLLPMILLTTLFFAWALPNNLTDTMLAAFKRIMSLSDTKTAWIQVVCYLLGYGCCALPAALFIKKYSYKLGVIFGLSLYALGTFMFYPAMYCLQIDANISFLMYLLAIFVLFAGLAVLETSANSYVCVLGAEETATRRLNFAQSFNPFGAISGVVISQIFILSQLNTLTATERASLPPDALMTIQNDELQMITTTYVVVGLIMLVLLLAILSCRMPDLKEGKQPLDLRGTWQRLKKNRKYVWSVVAQFFYVGAQISVWSFIIRYVMQQLKLDEKVMSLGSDASADAIIGVLRNVEPVAASFYNGCEAIGLDAMLPRTAEQAGATYYILSLILFVALRFVCTGLMKYIKPQVLLTVLSLTAVVCCLITAFAQGIVGVYALIAISGCMSLMFPTIYGIGIEGLKDDTKIGGSGMVMAIAGAALLTQIQGIISDFTTIEIAYSVPAVAFLIIAGYSIYINRTYINSNN
jgi:FHS family L-fucose permease-like MFS transporter